MSIGMGKKYVGSSMPGSAGHLIFLGNPKGPSTEIFCNEGPNYL